MLVLLVGVNKAQNKGRGQPLPPREAAAASCLCPHRNHRNLLIPFNAARFNEHVGPT